MTRYPRSAQTLIAELGTLVPDLDVGVDDLDGLGVYRTFRLTSKERKGLADVISAIADNRIVQHRSITNGVEVTFTHLVTADSNTRFGAQQAADLIGTRRARKPKPTE